MKISNEERQEIIEICKEYNIENYTIKDDGTVDVDDDVNLNRRKLTELPLKFGIVNGYFSCSNNELTSLVGGPEKLDSYFNCSNNELTSLVGGPEKLGGSFWCENNQLTSLIGAPREVGGNFWCYSNQLTSLKGSPLIVRHNFYCKNNPKDNPKELEIPFTIIGGKFINI